MEATAMLAQVGHVSSRVQVIVIPHMLSCGLWSHYVRLDVIDDQSFIQSIIQTSLSHLHLGLMAREPPPPDEVVSEGP